MKYINHKRIKFICLILFGLNSGYWGYVLYDGITIDHRDFSLAFIIYFLILLFYFIATTYFVYINDQMVNFRNDLKKVHGSNSENIIRLNGVVLKNFQNTISRLVEFQKDIDLNKELIVDVQQAISINQARIEQFRMAINQELKKYQSNLNEIKRGLENNQFNLKEVKKYSEAINNTLPSIATKTSVNNLFQLVDNFEKIMPSKKFIARNFEYYMKELSSINNKVVKINSNQISADYFDNKFKFTNVKISDEAARTKNQFSGLKYELNSNYNRLDALFSIYKVLDLKHPLPIMHEWTISSDYGHLLLQSVLSKPGIVFDIGSGISTLIAGYAVKKINKGRVISLEHDPYYYKLSSELIIKHELQNFVELHLCPLIDYTIEDKKWKWYDISKIVLESGISTMVVDGPPGLIQKESRYPAIPILKSHIDNNTTILLDDGDREDEQKIAEKWCKNYDLKSEFIKSHKGIIILRK